MHHVWPFVSGQFEQHLVWITLLAQFGCSSIPRRSAFYDYARDIINEGTGQWPGGNMRWWRAVSVGRP